MGDTENEKSPGGQGVIIPPPQWVKTVLNSNTVSPSSDTINFIIIISNNS